MTATSAEQIPDSPATSRRDWRIIGLLGAAHSCSHFYQLVLPTLFLPLAGEFGYNFSQLGLLASIFYLVSCLGQASSGFVVDRIGPTPVLRFGLGCFVVSALLIGIANNYFVFAVAAFIGGAGNSVFHPVDYSIINRRVSPLRLGHAYSAHGFTGNLGWALTPVFMTTIIHLADWRTAVFSAGFMIACVLFVVWLNRNLLEGRERVAEAKPAKTGAAAARSASPSVDSVGHTLSVLLKKPALWGAFFFFACTAIASSAVQNFTIPMLGDVYGIDKVLAGTTLSGYMLASAIGMLVGGFLVSSTPRTEFIIAVSLVLAGLLLVVLAVGVLPPLWAMALVGLAGFCSGVATPSRDMLIRRVAPRGATGAVYGLVYSGIDVGSSLGPIGFGFMMDIGLRQGPWVGAAVAFVVAAWAALMVAKAAAAADRSAVAVAA